MKTVIWVDLSHLTQLITLQIVKKNIVSDRLNYNPRKINKV